MSGFELQISGVGSDCSTNCATNGVPLVFLFSTSTFSYFLLFFWVTTHCSFPSIHLPSSASSWLSISCFSTSFVPKYIHCHLQSSFLFVYSIPLTIYFFSSFFHLSPWQSILIRVRRHSILEKHLGSCVQITSSSASGKNVKILSDSLFYR